MHKTEPGYLCQHDAGLFGAKNCIVREGGGFIGSFDNGSDMADDTDIVKDSLRVAGFAVGMFIVLGMTALGCWLYSKKERAHAGQDIMDVVLKTIPTKDSKDQYITSQRIAVADFVEKVLRSEIPGQKEYQDLNIADMKSQVSQKRSVNIGRNFSAHPTGSLNRFS